jgi:hypothetical protein
MYVPGRLGVSIFSSLPRRTAAQRENCTYHDDQQAHSYVWQLWFHQAVEMSDPGARSDILIWQGGWPLLERLAAFGS